MPHVLPRSHLPLESGFNTSGALMGRPGRVITPPRPAIETYRRAGSGTPGAHRSSGRPSGGPTDTVCWHAPNPEGALGLSLASPHGSLANLRGGHAEARLTKTRPEDTVALAGARPAPRDSAPDS